MPSRSNKPLYFHDVESPPDETSGRCAIAKVLLSTECELNCLYCPFRADRNAVRRTLEPEALAKGFLDLWRRGKARGIFLSSSVRDDPVRSMDRLLKAAELIRRGGFGGYLHLKILPGAEDAQIERAVALASRVSTNLEAPDPQSLTQIAPDKDWTSHLLDALRTAKERIRASGRRVSLVTQLVVGAAGERDRDILYAVGGLIRELGLARVYFSPFEPIPDTPLEHLPPTPSLRAARLYQAEFLVREYGFAPEQLPFNPDGNLPLDLDPKEAYARAHPELFPVEVNEAGYRQLVLVPGIGPKGAKRILGLRRSVRIKSLEDLRALGVRTSRAAPYILLNGRKPRKRVQVSLF